MKLIRRVLPVILTVMMSVITVEAQTFSYTYGGKTLKYNVLNSLDHTCEVSAGTDGDVIIPNRVGYNNEIFIVTAIGSRAFYNRTDLTSVSIPNSVTTIESEAFYSCIGLTSVSIPNSVTTIGNCAFAYCRGLTELLVDYNNKEYCSIDGVLFNKNLTSILQFPCGKNITYYEIPNSVTAIGNCAFADSSGLTSVTIPSYVKTIGYSAFANCANLEKIYYNTYNPVTADQNVFSDYSKPTLFVPASAINKFYITMPWGLFQKIEPITGHINLNQDNLYLNKGDTYTLIATTTGSLSGLTWSSSNPSVATVNQNGTVTAVSGGETTITVSANNLDNNTTLTASCQVTVSPSYTLSYILKDGKAWVSSMKADELVDVVIPEKVKLDGSEDYYDVVGLEEKVFQSNTNLRSVIIPNSVTTIGTSAFNSCRNLNSISIPNSVTAIEDSVFYYCFGLTSVTIPNSVKTIGNYAFTYCRSLKTVVIPNSVTSIGNYAFSYCADLTSVTLSNSVTTIGNRAFNNCVNLTSVFIPNSVTSIGDYAFSGCISLTSVSIPNSVTSLGGRLFIGCFDLASVSIPNSVITIGDEAFARCISLTSVFIPNSVITIGDGAFSSCTELTSVTIPNSVTSIGNGPFNNCTSLTEILVDSNNKEYCSIEGVLFNINVTNIIQYPCAKNGIHYIIPNSVTSIGNYAFRSCSGLTSVIIPNSVTNIGDYAFYYCANLDKIYYDSENPVFAAQNVFSDYTNPTLYVPASAINKFYNTVPWNQFQKIEPIADYISLDKENISIKIGKTATLTATISGDLSELVWSSSNPAVAVVDQNGTVSAVAEGEATITVSATNLKNNTAFNASCHVTVKLPYILSYIEREGKAWVSSMKADELVDVVIPEKVKLDGSEDYYDVVGLEEKVFQSNTNLRSVIIPNSVTTIGSSAFNSCRNLISINIPNSVKTIGNNAFYACSGLTSINISNSVTIIGDRVFSACKGLTSINIPNSVTTIGNYAFYDCCGLSSISIPNSVISIGNFAFRDCSGLTSINIPNSVITIGDCVFWGCSGLTSIIIPNSVISIGTQAFQNCSSLTKILVDSNNKEYRSIDGVLYNIEETNIIQYPCAKNGTNYIIPNSVTAIGPCAFYGCINLTSVTIPNSVITIGGSAFRFCSNLKSLFILTSITSIGDVAFANCANLDKIYYDSDNPVTASENVFSDYSKPTLFVPASAINKFYSTKPWNQFQKIEEYKFSGVGEMEVDVEIQRVEVYNLNGSKVAYSLDNLPAGIYIVRQDGKTRKVAIK